MPAGRHRKPDVVKLLEGNPGKRELNLDQPYCDQPPIMPQHIFEDALAAQAWNEVLEAMPPGVYSRLDTAVLAQYAQAYAMMIKASDDMATLYIVTEKGPRVNPAINVWLDMSSVVARCASLLGLVPTARSKLHVPASASKKSRLAGLIKSQ